ncbi:carbohydrate sulfotransferase 11-like [Ylistrum balloti]|uniref:carbohydrate sulfotransferase 11-like n=1 Tax=Ylistrum balloti TaxID=509963 RepID=UPI002905DBE6|nr:carbohydrate sulfotransferase 11-like [Ylistrum balloti]
MKKCIVCDTGKYQAVVTPKVSDVNKERKERIQRVCSTHENEFRRNKSMVDLSPHMYIDLKHNLTYCFLLKSGYTFWSMLFQIVRGDFNITSPFDPVLYSRRGKGIQSLNSLQDKQRKLFFNNSFSFMFTRDPYSRLLSGYTDKLFMPNYHWRDVAPSIAKVTRRHSERCIPDMRFSELIKFIIHSEEKGLKRDGHYQFAFDFCDPCQYQYDFIGKIETVKQDTQFLLEKMNQTKVLRSFEHSFKEQYTNFTIKERIDMLFMSNNSAFTCNDDFFNLQRKMWKGFQMNGIISKNSKYPITEEKSKSITPEMFRDVVFKSIGDAASSEVSRRNKAEALLEAYSTVDMEDLDKLSRLLQPDCEIFGYDCRPSYLFQNRKPVKPWYFDILTA